MTRPFTDADRRGNYARAAVDLHAELAAMADRMAETLRRTARHTGRSWKRAPRASATGQRITSPR